VAVLGPRVRPPAVALAGAALAAWVARSCEASGVPVHVTDPQVLAHVRALL